MCNEISGQQFRINNKNNFVTEVEIHVKAKHSGTPILEHDSYQRIVREPSKILLYGIMKILLIGSDL